MNRTEVEARIRQNLEEREMPFEELRVRMDPYGDWQIAVISGAFDALSAAERREAALGSLVGEIELDWLDLLTPEERKWTGSLPAETEEDDLPLWPQSLARGSDGEGVRTLRFPSDRDDDLEPPIVATFYSLRGGVGRSTALAYTSRILASKGSKVVCVDMDLEAPGLASLFGVEKQVEEGKGVVSLLMALDQGADPDFASHLLRVDDGDDLYLLPAGLPSADYARRLGFIEPEQWYREDPNPLRKLLDGLRKGLPFRPDVVLFDARTGITPMSGPLLFDLADLAIVTFFPHPQARLGTKLLTRGLLASHTWRSANGKGPTTPEPRFLVSPIPASKASEVVQRYEHRSLEWIASWLEEANALRANQGDPPLSEADLSHFVRYREDVATSDQALEDTEIWRSYQPVAEWIEGFLVSSIEEQVGETLEQAKPRILEELRFSQGTAEAQDRDTFLSNFVRTEQVEKALDPADPLVLGRKGTGKTAIFRFLAESEESRSIVVHAPSDLRAGRDWLLSSDGFQGIDEAIGESEGKVVWRHFWGFYLAVAVAQRDKLGELPKGLAGQLETIPRSQLQVVRSFEHLSQVKNLGLELDEWARALDVETEPETLLLLDGLDTGFGSDREGRERRRRAIEGLFDLWMEWGGRFENLRFKILLREDIWRGLRFQNKSHLHGRSETLQWRDQAAYFKVVLEQARASSEHFREVLKSSSGGGRLASRTTGEWTRDDVLEAWKLLVIERMKGGKSAFTRNWVWNRLGDANGDHAPRHLLQLFGAAVDWERQEQQQTPYMRSVLRPRSLVQCLDTVSNQAVEALSEEFTELEELMERLGRIGRTPVPAEELKDHEEAIELAREVGLLEAYEEVGDRVIRYRVPDLYRSGLGMVRKGQA